MLFFLLQYGHLCAPSLLTITSQVHVFMRKRRERGSPTPMHIMRKLLLHVHLDKQSLPGLLAQLYTCLPGKHMDNPGVLLPSHLPPRFCWENLTHPEISVNVFFAECLFFQYSFLSVALVVTKQFHTTCLGVTMQTVISSRYSFLFSSCRLSLDPCLNSFLFW